MKLLALLVTAALAIQPPSATRTATDSLLAADRAHSEAASKTLVPGFTNWLADDVVFLFPGAPLVQGKARVQAMLDTLPDAARTSMSWAAVRVEVSNDGSRGFTYGYGKRSAPGDTSYLKYIAYWKQVGGLWRVAGWVLGPRASAQAAELPAACASRDAGRRPNAQPGGDATALRSALLRVDGEFASMSAATGAMGAFATYIADDGAAMGGARTGVVCGRDAVSTQFDGLPPGALTWTPRIADAAPSGDLGFTVGVATFQNGGQSSTSKYLTVWQRQQNGDWRFVIDGGNGTTPPKL
ncbi:MAG: nuclear transport factor 2 family protein [Gemmatimonadota bacterium]|nr:nuclear transport factor 2 family protein [Gemmatimonadota bacterium]